MTATHLDALLARFHDGICDVTDRMALADVLLDAGRDELADAVRSGRRITPAASAFVSDVVDTWDSLDAYLATAESGLSDADATLLQQLCGEERTASDYGQSVTDVTLFVLGHVACVTMREAGNE